MWYALLEVIDPNEAVRHRLRYPASRVEEVEMIKYERYNFIVKLKYTQQSAALRWVRMNEPLVRSYVFWTEAEYQDFKQKGEQRASSSRIELIVLIEVNQKLTMSIAEKLFEYIDNPLPEGGVVRIEITTGPFEIHAKIWGPDPELAGKFLIETVQLIPGVTGCSAGLVLPFERLRHRKVQGGESLTTA